MGSLISGFVSGLYVLKSGSMNTGAMKSTTNEKTTATAVPQIHHVFGARRNTAYKHNQEDRAADERDSETNQLLAKPCRETLRGKSVLMLAKEVFVNVERKAQDINEQQIQQRCNRRLAGFCISLVVPRNRVAALKFVTTAAKSILRRPQDNPTESASNRPRNTHLIFHACLSAHCPTTPCRRSRIKRCSTAAGRGSRCRSH